MLTRKQENEVINPFFLPVILEPTDIRNWFSSYVYESPSYDTSTTDGFRDPVWKENKSGKDGFLVDNSHRENEEGLEGYNEKGTDGEAVSDLQSEGLAKCITSWRDNKQKTQPVSEVLLLSLIFQFSHFKPFLFLFSLVIIVVIRT